MLTRKDKMAADASVTSLKGIALFEASKGALVILAGIGWIAFLHKDAQAVAEAIVAHVHSNPAFHHPTIFLALLEHPTDFQLWALGGSALVYVAMRFTEAYGLWHMRTWALWLGVWSGGTYIPVELYEAVAHPSAIHVAMVTANALIVVYLALKLSRRQAAA
jgi:uncharacterized membrane protein (DUF2068 family)